MSGQKLPGSKFDARGEVFTFGGDAFAAGASSLSGGARNQAKALAEYLNIGKKGRLRIEAYDSANGVGQKRAESCATPWSRVVSPATASGQWQEGCLHPGALGRGHHRAVMH